MTGIEPAQPAWKASVLPLNYICKMAGPGFEPGSTGHEPVKEPLLYPASINKTLSQSTTYLFHKVFSSFVIWYLIKA